MIKNKIYIIIFFLIAISINGQSTGLIPKKAGICFRVDDNALISQYRDYYQVFKKYNKNFCFAMNLALSEFDSQNYRDSIRSYQQRGNELMDHTPNHRTNFFITKFDTSEYINKPGVDHLAGNKVCLQFMHVDTLKSIQQGSADIDSNTVTGSHNEFKDLNFSEIVYIYFPQLDTLAFISNPDDDNHPNNNSKLKIKDLWENEIDLGDHDNYRYFLFTYDNVHMTNDALKLLAKETQRLDSLYNFQRAYTWIQPGGRFSLLYRNELKSAMGDPLGYKAGAVYPFESLQVFNEYDPNEDKKFGMQWGDFLEDERDLDYNKKVIADGIAKHEMMIGHSHFDHPQGSWADYLAETDSLLHWCDTNNIPVRTYTDWSDILYNQTPDPYENIIPPLSVDLDKNGIPDGYDNVFYPGNADGIWSADPDTTGPEGFSYSISQTGKITFIEELGGLEKGENDFEIWTKGSPGDSVRVEFTGSYPSNNVIAVFKFPAGTSNWKKYSLAQMNKSLFINDTLSVMDIEFYCSDYSGGTVSISGMSLSKKVEIASLEMNVLDTLPAQAGDSVRIEVIAKDEFGNPHSNYYNYSLEITGSSTAYVLPSANRNFNGSDRDTVVVIDTTAGSFNLTAKLASNPSVSASSQIDIIPSNPKYLVILSSQDSITVGGSRLLQAALEDTFHNRIPDSLITFKALSGNGHFSNSLQNISVATDSAGVAKDQYTASTSVSYKSDSIKVNYSTTLADTIVLPLKAAYVNKIILTVLDTLPAYDGDSIKVEAAVKDTFDNPVSYTGNYIMSVIGSSTAKFMSDNGFSFNSNDKDTLFVSDSLAGQFKIVAKLQENQQITDTTDIEVIYSGKFADIKIFLEGPYNTGSHSMAVGSSFAIPLTSPYPEAPDTITVLPQDAIDWILVTLRKDTDPDNPDPSTAVNVISQSVIVNKSGKLIDPHTGGNISFNVAEDDYYIVIKHRNHLAVMSSQKIHLSK